MIKGLKRIKKNKKLYHLSLYNHNGETFRPRIPASIASEHENNTLKRVCFSTSISGAYKAITFDCYGNDIMYVHVPNDIDKIIKNGSLYKPNSNLVFDSYFTREHWIRKPVKMKCIGKIKISWRNATDIFGHPCKVHFKWLEKYE